MAMDEKKISGTVKMNYYPQKVSLLIILPYLSYLSDNIYPFL